MRTIDNQLRADRVGEFYKKFSPSRYETYFHFRVGGVAKSSLKSVMDRYDKTGTSVYGNEHGPKPAVEKGFHPRSEFFGERSLC